MAPTDSSNGNGARMADSDALAPLTAFVNFPSPYTQSLLERALVAVLPAVSMSDEQPAEDAPPRLQW